MWSSLRLCGLRHGYAAVPRTLVTCARVAAPVPRTALQPLRPVLQQSPLQSLRIPSLRTLCTKTAAPVSENSIGSWLHFGAAVGTFVVADYALKAAFQSAGISFPSSLVGMFGILGSLIGLSATGNLAAAEAAVAAARPALTWIARFLPIFYVPALVMLPLAVGNVDTTDLAKIGVLLSIGFPATLLAGGVVIMGIRALTGVSLLPVAAAAKLPPFSPFLAGSWFAAIAASAVAITQIDPSSEYAPWVNTFFLLSCTVSGLVFGTTPPAAIASFMPHPVVTTFAAAHLGCYAAGLLTGGGYWSSLATYMTKGKDGAPKGAGDYLMGLLGVVVLTFGFHIYGQRALLARHAAEILGCAVIVSLGSMFATCAAGRALQMPPDLTLAMAPRSVTVALAMPIAEQLKVPEELIPVCAAAVLVTGLVGAMFCQRLLTAGRFTDPLTRGIATASSCHGFGTAALAAGEPQAMPFAALSYGLTGIAASLWATVPAVRSMLAATAGKPAEA